MIFDYLIPELRQRFPDRAFDVSFAPEPCLVVPAIHPEVGNLVITDEGYEVTLQAGNFTHGHFSNYDEHLSEDQKNQKIAEDVAQFMEELFADRIVLWGSHGRSGGWFPRGERPSPLFRVRGRLFVWSGPLRSG
jgi:hypothetical protein